MLTSTDEFERFIQNLISKFRLDSKFSKVLMDPLSIKVYRKAFTHSSYSPRNNYEVFEQLGDITFNKFLVWYFHNRFTSFNSPFGVKIVARLRIKYGSKQLLADLANQFNFWDQIRLAESISAGRKLSILEDTFEAFIGATEYLIDQRLYLGLGYICCYQLLKSIFDSIPIHLSYEQLFDAKTRLKELFDVHKDTLGTIAYEYSKSSSDSSSIVHIYRLIPSSSVSGTGNDRDRERVFLAMASSRINKSISEQKASEEALKILSQQGFSRDIPNEYKNILAQLI